MMQKLNDIGGSQAAKVRRIGKVLTAVGEALYYFAEKKRAAAEKIKFPVYKGSGDRKEVQEFIGTKVADWMKKKEPAILVGAGRVPQDRKAQARASASLGHCSGCGRRRSLGQLTRRVPLCAVPEGVG